MAQSKKKEIMQDPSLFSCRLLRQETNGSSYDSTARTERPAGRVRDRIILILFNLDGTV